MSELIHIQDPSRPIDDLTGPRSTRSLQARRVPLVNPDVQLTALEEAAPDLNFSEALRAGGVTEALHPVPLEIFQINLGKLCNMTCRHCHVDSGPDRTDENMDRRTVDACLAALDATEAHTVDLTGGAPELNPHFRYLVEACARRGKHIIDRCNLTVLLLPRNRDLPQFLADHGVEIVCSLPHYRARNTDAQRGDGTYEKSIEALKRLNAVGYGAGDPHRRLTLMSNPSGAFLAGDQAKLEREWKTALMRNHGISFDRLFCLNNMPISRFLEWLLDKGKLAAYMDTLKNAFNPAAAEGLMCRNTLSVSWDGRLFDCDFNQMLDLDLRYADGALGSIHNFDFKALASRTLVVDRFCFGCTAGAGSSCGGATA